MRVFASQQAVDAKLWAATTARPNSCGDIMYQ
jgi:hypothetical protein